MRHPARGFGVTCVRARGAGGADLWRSGVTRRLSALFFPVLVAAWVARARAKAAIVNREECGGLTVGLVMRAREA